METDSPEKHSYAGHDCADCQSSDTKDVPKCHPWELWDKWHIQRWLPLCFSEQMQPLILPWTPRSDLKKVGRSPFLPLTAGQRKSPNQKPLKSPGCVSPSQHIPGPRVINKPILSAPRSVQALLPWWAQIQWWRMVQEMPVTARLPFLPSLAF